MDAGLLLWICNVAVCLMIDPDLAYRLARRTLELVSIPSVTGDEARLCNWVIDQARACAPDAVIHRMGNSVVIIPPFIPGRQTIGLFGHLDTVKPSVDQPVALADGRVYGCGASDMKGALAGMLELLGEPGLFAVDGPTQANAVFVFYDKEEGPMLESGLIPVLASGLVPPLVLALCLEPTDNQIQAGCMGGLHAKVTVRGRRAHSARPWQGDNAVSRAIPALSRIAAFGKREVWFGSLAFFEVMNVTQATTDNSRNVIPDSLVMNVNYRFAPGKTVDVARAALETVIRGPTPELEVPEGIEIEVVDEAPSGVVYLDEPRLKGWRQRMAIQVAAKQAWTDVARLTQAGIPAVNFGPGMTAQAHQAGEYVPIDMLEQGYVLLRGLFVG